MVFTDFRHRLLAVADADSASVCRLFETQAKRQPTAPAVEFMGQCWSYQTLNTHANQLAHYLREQGVGPDVLVGLCLDHSFEMIVGILAILKAGGAYVPIDPNYPAERLDWILKDCQVACLLTQHSLVSVIPVHTAKNICVDTDWPVIAQQPVHNLEALPTVDSLAYVIYTSGSTGEPKGVMVGQTALANFVSAANQAYGIVAADRVLQFASISFDAAVEEIFLTLTQGATLVLRTQDMLKSIPDFLKVCETLQLTVLDLPTAFWHQLCASLETCPLASTVRLTIIGGERALPQWVNVWKQSVNSQVRLVNTYGPTETTVVATCCYLTGPDAVEMSEGGTVPIGQPLGNAQTHILDEHMTPIPVGHSGELYVSGKSLATGYLNRPDLTAERFVLTALDDDEPETRLYKTGDLARYREDGQLEFLGRVDHQIKIRGFRVELQEIETLLENHSAVQSAVVVAQEDSLGHSRLVAYVVKHLQYCMPGNLSCDLEQLEQEQIKQWQVIHNDDHLNTVNTDWDDTFNISGWISSYTGKLLPANEMQEWLDNTVERILNLKPERVLELGCGTGLLLFQVAPHCKSYMGTDISEVSLDHVKKQLSKNQTLASRVTLKPAAADDFEDIPPASYDTVILNSVLQYFPSIDYLVQVLEQAVRFIKPGGSLFIGDVRNYQLQETFATAIELFKADDKLSITELWQRVQKRIFQEEELTIDPSFFLALKKHLPKISQVQIFLKQSQYHNELTQFRYDVVLHVGSTPQSTIETSWSDWQLQDFNLAKLRQILEKTSMKAIGLSGIPNVRILESANIADGLKQAKLAGNVADLRKYLTQTVDGSDAVDPEDIRQLATELAYDVTISWPSTESKGAFNALFKPQTAVANYKLGSIESLPLDLRRPSIQPWSTYANNPLQAKIAHTLAAQLRSYTAQKLPKYMVPSAFVVLDTFPLNANGKIDRKALPVPDSSRSALSVPFVAPQTAQEEKLAEIWSDVLDISPIGVNDSFFELGGDSLRLMQLVAQIERSFEGTLSFTDFFKQPTISALYRQLRHQQQSSTVTEWMPLSQLRAEASLDLDSPSVSLHWPQPESHWINPKSILLTGATGFIGISLLHDLLQQTEATIYCLVRAQTLTEGYQKLRQSLQQNFPGIDIPYARVKPLIGNIARPLLGLDIGKFKYLADTIDVIYHSAASVNLFYPFGALKAANVVGTQSILTLASYVRLKPVHYISTLDVFESLVTTGPSIIYENDSIVQGVGISGGYAQSKWVAEYLVTQAIAAGIPACIYRPGMVTGHTQTGICNTTDLMCRFLKSVIQLEAAPDLDWMIDMTPVDYVSQAIVHLSLQSKSLNQAFHLVNPNPYPLYKLVQAVNQLGYPISQVSYERWLNAFHNCQNALSPLAKIVTEILPGQPLTRLEVWLAGTQMFDCQNTLRGLSRTQVECPKVDDHLLVKYLHHIG
ncbi:amino acid adenylation domain-containing protein [Leptolyngbya cf. ectocarpi LEGE 11479]|uniref:Amino acid adenylation domain-containing protein n=1 Tax=Leptolyngbya cf. ectocarpi LEGE 11479 TaxID=1828722 RepID=A0A928ZX25_LEPEC|nr:amino acid adenylation domain-containing protein [Leptolyngbya ectocarpi]MBE9069079.1 amino acid adenylation domain-containing protein [Leptolyngbya cf. ectocarpi LEGE 11479]